MTLLRELIDSPEHVQKGDTVAEVRAWSRRPGS